MGIFLSTLEHSNVPLELREILSFTKAVTASLTKKIAQMPGVEGCVLLSTCNRTELYISSEVGQNPGKVLCSAAQVNYTPFEKAFISYENEDAVIHLLEVSAGLRSRIFGDDQIISQVKEAILIARNAGATDSILETLFRTAVSAGKEVRSQVRITAVPTSAASRAVELLETFMGGLEGKRAMVIGNGEMGRISASLLHNKGSDVTVTLRTYRHGETIVPPGCHVVPYEERFDHMSGFDCLISATSSPHFTIRAEDAAALKAPPPVMIDIAIPRDIQPETGDIEGITLMNIDDLADGAPSFSFPPVVHEILNKHEGHFYRWLNYKNCMPAVEDLKKSVLDRILSSRELEYGLDTADMLKVTVDRTVELITAGLSEQITSEGLVRCSEKISSRTISKPVHKGVST